MTLDEAKQTVRRYGFAVAEAPIEVRAERVLSMLAETDPELTSAWQGRQVADLPLVAGDSPPTARLAGGAIEPRA